MPLPRTFTERFHNLEDVQRMKYVPLGTTGMRVSVLGFGGGCFGSYGDFDQEEAKRVIREALRRGINYIDTAPYYGEGESESTIGAALQGVPRSAYYIATKVGRYSKDPSRAFDFTYDNVLRSVDESLSRLGLEYVDVVQVHDLEFAPSIDVVINQTLPALYEVVRNGKARFIGVTGYPVATLAQAVEKASFRLDVVLSYARSTLMDNTLEEYLPVFKAKEMGVIHASPTAMGLLTNSGPLDWHPGIPQHGELCSKAGEFCRENGVELGRLAVHHSLTRPGIDLNLIGMPTLAILADNIDVALNSIRHKEKQILDEIYQRFFRPSDRKHWENVEVDQYRKDRVQLGLA